MSLFEQEDVDQTIPENPLEVLVGEDKKYKDAQALARAAIEKDNHIRRIERENAEMRAEVTKHATLDEILTQIRSAQPAPVPPASAEPPSQNAKDPAEVEQLVRSLLERRDTEQRVNSNRALVEQKLAEVWGVDARLNLNKKAKELNVSLDYLSKLAQESPSVFFKTVDLQKSPSPAPSQIAPRSSVQTGVPDTNGSVRNQAYYEKLKATNPTEYFSVKTQNQMMKDALAQKEAFFN